MSGIRGLWRLAGAQGSNLYAYATRRGDVDSAIISQLQRCISSSSSTSQQEKPPGSAPGGSTAGSTTASPFNTVRPGKGRVTFLNLKPPPPKAATAKPAPLMSEEAARSSVQATPPAAQAEPAAAPAAVVDSPPPAAPAAEAATHEPAPAAPQAHQHDVPAPQPQQPAGTIHHINDAAAQQQAQPQQAAATTTPPTAAKPQASQPPPAAAAAAAAAAATHEAREQVFSELGAALLQPISRSKKYNGQLSPVMININGELYIDPEKTLTSTMRALHVIRQVLREDGHVYVVNSNPAMRPLMREAAACCTNSNVWFLSEPWAPGTLNNRDTRRLFKPRHQPNRALLAAKGLRIHNVHCEENVHSMPLLPWKDKWAMYGRREWNMQQRGGRAPAGPTGRQFLWSLNRVLEGEEAVVDRFQDPKQLQEERRLVRMLLVLDSSVNRIALKEAQGTNVITAALVNHHSDLSGITFPIYARDSHVGYQHTLLDYLLKVVNVRE